MKQVENSNNLNDPPNVSKQQDTSEKSNEILKTLFKLQQRSRFTLFLAWIALFFTVIGIAAGYKNWMQINERAKQAAVGVSELKQQATHFADKSTVVAFNQQLFADFNKNKQQFTQSLKVLERVEKTTQYALETVKQQATLLTQQQEALQFKAPAPNSHWQLAELRFLLKLANQRLHLNKDKNGALEALKLAEIALLKLGSSKYLAVREKINEEVVLLEAFLVPNLTAISQRIAELIKVIDVLPVEHKIIKQQKITLLPEVTAEQNSLLSGLVGVINDAVVIQKFDQSVQQTIGENEKKRLKNLLYLRFEMLRLMVLQGLDYDYHQELNKIKKILNKYYPELIKGSLQKLLDELDQVELSPTPPDISGSLLLLEQLSQAKLRE